MSARATVRVLVVDDQQPFRDAARTVLGLTPGFELAGEAIDGDTALAAYLEHRPDLVLMDVNMPGTDGTAATRAIVAQDPSAVVVLFSTYDPDDLPEALASCGAADYVHKEELAPHVLQDLWDRHGPATAP